MSAEPSSRRSPTPTKIENVLPRNTPVGYCAGKFRRNFPKIRYCPGTKFAVCLPFDGRPLCRRSLHSSFVVSGRGGNTETGKNTSPRPGLSPSAYGRVVGRRQRRVQLVVVVLRYGRRLSAFRGGCGSAQQRALPCQRLSVALPLGINGDERHSKAGRVCLN